MSITLTESELDFVEPKAPCPTEELLCFLDFSRCGGQWGVVHGTVRRGTDDGAETVRRAVVSVRGSRFIGDGFVGRHNRCMFGGEGLRCDGADQSVSPFGDGLDISRRICDRAVVTQELS